jgi:hypothetical protein
MCRAACVLLVLLASACSPSDEASPRPTLTSPTLPTPPMPPVSSTRLQLSGRVLDQNGTPVSGALVEVDYPAGGGSSNPPSQCPGFGFCWLVTRTNNLGEYSIEFEPQPRPGRICGAAPASSCGLGFVYSFHDGYEADVQWVPTGSSPVVQDLRLRPSRSIPAGASTVVSVDPSSSLCTDLEDLWRMESRCAIVVIESGAGTLHVEARPAAGTPAPSIFWYTSGNYAGLITRPASGAVAIPVRGGTYRVLVAVPEGVPSQQFTVTTTLR